MATREPSPVSPPDDAYARQRWIPHATVKWVNDCERILLEHGVVVGGAGPGRETRYRTRDAARHHARRLKRLLVELRKFEGWQLREHMEKLDGGWVWSIEYLGRSDG